MKLRKMFVVLGGSVTSVDRCGSVTVTIALMLTTLDIAMKDCMKPVMKGKTVKTPLHITS